MAFGSIVQPQTGAEGTNIDQDNPTSISMLEKSNDIMDIKADYNNITPSLLDNPKYVFELNQKIDDLVNDPDVSDLMLEFMANGGNFEDFWSANFDSDGDLIIDTQYSGKEAGRNKMKEFRKYFADLESIDTINSIQDTKKELKKLEIELTHQGQNDIAWKLREKAKTEISQTKKKKLLMQSYMMDHVQDFSSSIQAGDINYNTKYYKGIRYDNKDNVNNDLGVDTNQEVANDYLTTRNIVQNGWISEGLDWETLKQLEDLKLKKRIELAINIATVLVDKFTNEDFERDVNNTDLKNIAKLFIGESASDDEIKNFIQGNVPISYVDEEGNPQVIERGLRGLLSMFTNGLLETNVDLTTLDKDTIQNSILKMILNIDGELGYNSNFKPTIGTITRLYLGNAKCFTGDVFVDGNNMPGEIDKYDPKMTMKDRYNDRVDLDTLSVANDKIFGEKQALRRLLGNWLSYINYKGTGKTQEDIRAINIFKKSVNHLILNESNDIQFGQLMTILIACYNDPNLSRGDLTNPERRTKQKTRDMLKKKFLGISSNIDELIDGGIFVKDSQRLADLMGIYIAYRDDYNVLSKNMDEPGCGGTTGNSDFGSMPFMSEVFGVIEDCVRKNPDGTFNVINVYTEHSKLYKAKIVGFKEKEPNGLFSEGIVKEYKELNSNMSDKGPEIQKLYTKLENGKIPNLIKIIYSIEGGKTSSEVISDLNLKGYEAKFAENYANKRTDTDSLYIKVVQSYMYGYNKTQLYRRIQLLRLSDSISGKKVDDNLYKYMYNVSDFNCDGKILSNDDLGIKTGRQIMDVMEQSVAFLMAGGRTGLGTINEGVMLDKTKASEVVNCNILKFVMVELDKRGDKRGYEELKKIVNLDDLTRTWEFLKENPQYIALISQTLRNTPVDLRSVFLMGDKAYEDYNKKFEKRADALSNMETLTDEDKKLIEKLVDGGYSLITEKLNDAGKPIPTNLRENLKAQIINSFISNKINVAGGLGTTILQIPVGDAGLVSIDMGIFAGDGGSFGGSIGGAYQQNLGNGRTWTTGVGAGLSNMGNGLGAYTGINKDVRTNKGKRVVVGANIALGGGTEIIPSIGLGLSYFNDKIKTYNIDYDGLRSGFNSIDIDSLTADNYESIIKFKLNVGKLTDQEKNLLSYKVFEIALMTKDLVEDKKQEIFVECASTAISEYLIAKEDGKTQVSGMGVGVQTTLLGGPLAFMPTFFVQFIKYRGYSSVVKQSLRNVLLEEYTGANNDIIERSINTNGSINYDKMVEKMNINLMIADDSLKIKHTKEGSKDCYKIPEGVWKNAFADIYINQSLMGYIKFDNDGNLIIPANIDIRMFESSENNNSRRSLSLGGGNVNLIGTSRDLKLTFNGNPSVNTINDWKGDPELYVGDLDIKEQDVVDALKNIISHNDHYPLNPNGVEVDGNSVYIDIKSGMTITPTSPVKVIGNKLVFPKNGKLTISGSSPNFSAEFITSINPLIEFAYTEEINNIGITNQLDYTEKNSLSFLFPNDGVNLKNVEYKDLSAFSDFLGNANKNPSDLTDTAGYILKFLPQGALYDKIFTLKNNSSRTLQENRELTYLIDMVKVKTAISDNYERKTIQTLLNERKISFNKMADGGEDSGEVVSLIDDSNGNFANILTEINIFRDEYIKDDGPIKKGDLNYGDVYNNVLGYTAFYRRDRSGNDNNNRGFSMTPPGNTKLLLPPKIFTDQKKVCEWYQKKLKKNEYESQILASAIEGMDGFPNGFKGALIDNSGISYLGEFLESATLNSDGKLVGFINKDGKTLRLEFNMIFYLLGECGNESIGIQIDKITLETGESVQPVADGGRIYSNNPETISRIGLGKTGNGFTFGLGMKVKDHQSERASSSTEAGNVTDNNTGGGNLGDGGTDGGNING